MASALIPLERGRRVVVRSPRGVEVAEVISRARESLGGSATSTSDRPSSLYRIIRPTTDADELLVNRLERYKFDAIESCRKRLRASHSDVTLLDVDQLLDGGTLLMHFLGDMDTTAEQIAAAVADEYESIVRTNHLSELLTDGCSGCGV